MFQRVPCVSGAGLSWAWERAVNIRVIIYNCIHIPGYCKQIKAHQSTLTSTLRRWPKWRPHVPFLSLLLVDVTLRKINMLRVNSSSLNGEHSNVNIKSVKIYPDSMLQGLGLISSLLDLVGIVTLRFYFVSFSNLPLGPLLWTFTVAGLLDLDPAISCTLLWGTHQEMFVFISRATRSTLELEVFCNARFLF